MLTQAYKDIQKSLGNPIERLREHKLLISQKYLLCLHNCQCRTFLRILYNMFSIPNTWKKAISDNACPLLYEHPMASTIYFSIIWTIIARKV